MAKLNVSEMKRRGKPKMTESASKHRFQWWVTLTCKDREALESAKDSLVQWRNKLCREEKMQIGYFAVVSEETRKRKARVDDPATIRVEPKSRLHWHLLMVGRDRSGRTLHNVFPERWAKEWWRKNCAPSIPWYKGAWIIPVYDVQGVSQYLVKNWNPSRPKFSDVVVYGQRVLSKFRDDQPSMVADKPAQSMIYRVRKGEEEYERVKEEAAVFIKYLESKQNTNYITEEN